MSDTETPRRGRGRPPGSVSKTPNETNTPSSRSRSAKKAVEQPTSSRKKKDESVQAESASEADKVGPSTGRVTRKREGKKKAEKVPAAAADSDDESVAIVKEVDLKKVRSKTTTTPKRVPAVVKDEEEMDEEVEPIIDEQPTSSTASARRGKQQKKEKEPETSGKVTRSGRAAVDRMETGEEEGEEEEEKGKRTPSRSTRKRKQSVEEEDEDEEAPPVKGKKAPATRSAKKGKKAAAEEEEEEEEVEEAQPVKGKKAPASRSTKKGKKVAAAAEEDEEEQDEDEAEVVDVVDNVSPSATRWARRGKVVVDADEEAERKKKAAKSRKGKKGAVSDEEEEQEEGEEEEVEEAPPAKGKKGRGRGRPPKKAAAAGSDEEEEEEPATDKKLAGRSTRKGRKAAESDEEEEEKGEDEVEEEERPKKKQGRGARKRLNLDEEEEDEEMAGAKAKKGKALQSLESPEKPAAAATAEERKAARMARRAAARANDPPEPEDLKPLTPFMPEFVNDFAMEGELPVVSAVGVTAASDVSKNVDPKASAEALVIGVRNNLKSVYLSKDSHTFDNAFKTLSKLNNDAFDRKEGYSYPVQTYYREIQNQLLKMFSREGRESAEETEAKRRVIRCIARSNMRDFEELHDDQNFAWWNQVDFFLKQFITTNDPTIRANFLQYVGYLHDSSKEAFESEYGTMSQDEREEVNVWNMEASWKEPLDRGGAPKGEDEDRRMLDGHILKLWQRKRLYFALYSSIRVEEWQVRAEAVRAFAKMQDDQIPASFQTALENSPKDLIMRQLRDIHVNVRKVAIEVFRPTSPEQIQSLIDAAMQEKHENLRKLAFRQLGRLPLLKFNLTQRHALLAMLRDNMLGVTVEKTILHSWLYEMVYGENPNPIIYTDEASLVAAKKKKEQEKEEGAEKKAARGAEMKDRWATAPLRLLAYLDCVNKMEEVVWILDKASAIARQESGLAQGNGMQAWIDYVIMECDTQELAIITQAEFSHLLERDMSDQSRAVIVAFWHHCLQFIHKNKTTEGDKFSALVSLSPSMADLRSMIMDLLADEKERRAPRKELAKKANFDVTHPACVPTAAPLQATVTLLLASLHLLENTGEDTQKEEWRQLLFTIAQGEYCDLSPAMWTVVMRDLLKHHTAPAETDDLIYELAMAMGFNVEEHRGDSVKGGTPRRHSKTSPTKAAPSTPTSSRASEAQRRLDDRRFVLSRPDLLGMLSGALKTNLFTENDEIISIVFRVELDAYRHVTTNRLLAQCLECIDMFGLHSATMSERYIELVMENLFKPASQEDEDDEAAEEEEAARIEAEVARIREKQRNRRTVSELEMEYKRREKEERAARAEERRSKKGGRNHCRGLALAVLTDLIIEHSLAKVGKWLEASGKYTVRELFAHIETLAMEPDLDLVFNVAASVFKLTNYDWNLMKWLKKAVGLLVFRAMHPASFSHCYYRSCVLQFIPYFGSKSHECQKALKEVVIEMMSLLKMRSLDYKNIIDRGENAYKAFTLLTSSFAPSSLMVTARPTKEATAHAVLMKELGESIDNLESLAQKGRKIDMDHYNAVLYAMHGLDFCGTNAHSLRGIYDVVTNNSTHVAPFDKGQEAAKKAKQVIARLDVALVQINKIISLNKRIGVELKDEEAYLPYENDFDAAISDLRAKALAAGKEVTPERPTIASLTTPATKGRGARGESEKKLLSTLKKEPARSKSYAATAAAERREAKAAASSNTQATPSRSSSRLNAASRKRAAMMDIIEESDDDSN